MKTLLILIASILSNSLISSLLRNKAKPLFRNLVRRSVRYTARVASVCLIGCLTFVAGLVMTFSDLGTQISENGGLYFSPPLAFGIGLLVIGVLFVYVGAFSRLLSPWKDLEAEDLQHEHSSALSEILEAVLSSFQEGARHRPVTEERRERPTPSTAQTSYERHQEPIH